MDQSGDCVVIPENAQVEETINFSYEIIVLDIYFSPNSVSKKEEGGKVIFRDPWKADVVFRYFRETWSGLTALQYSIGSFYKKRKGYNLWIDDNLQPGGLKNAADKVIKLVKLVYNPFAFDIP